MYTTTVQTYQPTYGATMSQQTFTYRSSIMGDFDFSSKEKLIEFLSTDRYTSRSMRQNILFEHECNQPFVPSPYSIEIQSIKLTKHQANHAVFFKTYSTYANYTVTYTINLPTE